MKTTINQTQNLKNGQDYQSPTKEMERLLILRLVARPDRTKDKRFKEAVKLVKQVLIDKALLNDLDGWKEYHQGKKDGWSLESFIKSSTTYWDLVKNTLGDIRDDNNDWKKAKKDILENEEEAE